MNGVLDGVRDDQLDLPTPCPGSSVAALLDHLDLCSRTFVEVAREQTVAQGGRRPASTGAALLAGWRGAHPRAARGPRERLARA